MSAAPITALLLVNALLFIGFLIRSRNADNHRDLAVLSVLFFFSGMPALIYQVVWQRALFAIYGVNAESVAVVVTAFMLGLGAGSLAGGALSARFPRYGILLFAVAEFGVAIFGLSSLAIFHWVSSYTAGAGLGSVIFFSVALLLVPTVLMGASLPLLVEYAVLRTNRVGVSVSILYFVNTFGSAVACYLCAAFLLRDFGQSGSVTIAACANALVGAVAYLYMRRPEQKPDAVMSSDAETVPAANGVPLPIAMLLAGFSGFIALGWEIAWYRVFALASSDRAPAFALLLCTFLAGVAAGSYVCEAWAESQARETIVQAVGVMLLVAGAASGYLPPLVATLLSRRQSFLLSAPAFFVVAAMIGAVFPLLCRLSIAPDKSAGQKVSWVYISNILGSALGSLGIGFVALQYAGLRPVSMGLGSLAVVLGVVILFFRRGHIGVPRAWTAVLAVACVVAVPASARFYGLLYERLVFGRSTVAGIPFTHIVENRNGVIGVTKEAAVFGGGVYDGHFNVDPVNDTNIVERVYALSAFVPNPKRILVIGVASGSWAQILANHPQLDALDAVEINPGYLELIPQYAMVSSFPANPKVHIYVDDGRRWLLAHPQARYDLIVANTTYHWRDHASVLLSAEFLQLIRTHLNPGGVYYFNTTSSSEAISTALRVFPNALRVINFVAVSDSPMVLDMDRWFAVLRQYRLDGKAVFDPQNPSTQATFARYAALAKSLSEPPGFWSMESGESLRARFGRQPIITDDNMGLEWDPNIPIPWRQ